MIRTFICALALTCTTTAALTCSGHSKQTQSCAPGTYWDTESQTCAEIVNS